MTEVCLILEGTYPFVSGGVSTWIHQLINAMPDLRFSILYVSPFPNPRREYKYRIPPNVVDIQDLYLHDYRKDESRSWPWRRRRSVARLGELHAALFEGRWEAFDEMLPYFRDPRRALTFWDVFRSRETWAQLERFYERYGEEVSFLDFFWTWRSMYLPLQKTLQCPIPKARLYHTVSTGYAGIMASIAKLTEDRAMLLTEHGVYTYERLLEISQATWIYSPQRERFRIQRELTFFKRLWLGFFELIGKLTYQHADRIITLYEGNKTREILSGAPADRISIIPNGIDLDHYRDIPLKTPDAGPKKVAYIGRVVSIKDVKTFVHAARIVRDALPDVEFLVLGPDDEEPDYAQECRELARTLGVEKTVKFAGRVDMREYYPQVDLVVLTSFSEAQPYVILEANAVGIPVVATDVGACREMLEGRLPEDRSMGPSGLVTAVARPEETAAAIVKLLKDQDLWSAMSEAGRGRTMHFYNQNDLISQYLNLYEQMMR
ncbi:MAG: GT4 family glycosyltransferase PelF [Elusimicrobia bacterium]|nr:GT4 family glycosyltransferase PelF [Elusimicrobiota bacterium]